MDRPRVRIYTDYKSPYAFVANKPMFELEEAHGVEFEWLPYTPRIPEFKGAVEERTLHFWRKLRYLHMDARRHANAQGLVIKGPRCICDAFHSSDEAALQHACRALNERPLTRIKVRNVGPAHTAQ